MKKLLGILLLIVQLVGCATSQSITKGGILAGEKVKVPSRVLVMPMNDGVGRSDGPWTGSGVAMASGLKEALIENGFYATVGDSFKFDEAKMQAKLLKYDYVIKSTITEWEDNATEWSGKPDSLALSSELFDINSSNFISTATHREQSSGAALLSESTNRFVPIVSNRVIQRLFAIPSRKNESKEKE